jgi:predicted PurR-regulated permease PerM
MSDLIASARPVPDNDDAASAAAAELASILALQTGLAAIAALYVAREVIVPVTLAILLSFVLTPLVDLLRAAKLGRVPSVLLAVLLALTVLLAIGGVIGSQAAQLATKVPEYTNTIEQKLDSVRAATVDRVSALLDHLRHATTTPPNDGSKPQATPQKRDEAQPQSPSVPTPEAAPTGLSPLQLIQRYLGTVLSPFATMGIVVVVAIFVLLQKEDLRDRLIRLFGATDLHKTTVAMDDAARRLSKYFLTQLAINTSFGILIGIGLYFIGLPNPLLWGILSGLLRFVPYIGAFISAALPLALAMAVDPGWSMVIWTGGLYVGGEVLVSQAIEPVLYGHSTGLSPFAVIVAAIFWSWMWGPIGLILSMPLTLSVVVLGRYVERLAFLDILLGDRPALTPIESFYQRILAGDEDEALDHAELLLKERSLSSYYDEVILKGLQLAAADSQRGVLRPQQLQRIRGTVSGLVIELSEHDDAEPAAKPATELAGTSGENGPTPAPPPVKTADVPSALAAGWQGDTPVLCLAGNGPLDEVASAMLRQLLEKHGIGARVSAYREASREAIGMLDVNGVAMVCVSYLDITGTPSHLRYLMRRLRQRLPQALILIGLWPADDAVLTDRPLSAAIGADYYTTSLREAVNICVETATRVPADKRLNLSQTDPEAPNPRPSSVPAS